MEWHSLQNGKISYKSRDIIDRRNLEFCNRRNPRAAALRDEIPKESFVFRELDNPVERINEKSRDEILKKPFVEGSNHEADYFILKKDNQKEELSHHILEDYKRLNDQTCEHFKDIIAKYHVNYHEQN